MSAPEKWIGVEDAEALALAFYADTTISEFTINRMRAAIESLHLTEEPTGLSAVVRDAEGRLWQRTFDEPFPWRLAERPMETSAKWRGLSRYAPLTLIHPGVEVEA